MTKEVLLRKICKGPGCFYIPALGSKYELCWYLEALGSGMGEPLLAGQVPNHTPVAKQFQTRREASSVRGTLHGSPIQDPKAHCMSYGSFQRSGALIQSQNNRALTIRTPTKRTPNLQKAALYKLLGLPAGT